MQKTTNPKSHDFEVQSIQSPAHNQTDFFTSPIEKYRNTATYVDYDLPGQTETQTHFHQTEGDECCRTGIKSIGKKMQIERGRESGGGPQTIKHLDYDENDPSSISNLVNPCQKDMNRESIYFVKNTREAVCERCADDHIKLHHEVVEISDSINECQQTLMNVEANSLQMLSQKSALLGEDRKKLAMMEQDRRNFIAEQQQKVNQLHNYLDEKMRTMIAEYEKATEPDVVSAKNNID